MDPETIMEKRDDLPSWSECEVKCHAGTATPLERFIYDNEPGDNRAAYTWRKELLEVLNAR